ncbi:MAG: hypothetical protein ACRDYC_12220, partial [Acidimicrobiales bacterium]
MAQRAEGPKHLHWPLLRPETQAGLRLVYDANPRLARQLLYASVALGLLPTLFTLASGWLVGTAEHRGRVLWPLIAVAAAFLAGEIGTNVCDAIVEGFREQVEARRRERVMTAVLAPPGVAHVEDEEIADLIREGANNEWPNTSAFTAAVFGLTRLRVAAISSTVLVASFRWWLGLGLVVLWLVCGHESRRNQASAWQASRGKLRRAAYLRDLAFEPLAAKEVRVFGLGDWLLTSFSSSWHEVMRGVWRRRGEARARKVGVFVLVVAAHAAAFAVLAEAARAGHVGPGRLVVIVPAILAMAQLGSNNQFTLGFSLGTVALPAVAELERRLGEDPRFQVTGARSAAGLPEREIRFENVSFAYPAGQGFVYSGLDLTIAVGRSLAIVGANGAGKT